MSQCVCCKKDAEKDYRFVVVASAILQWVIIDSRNQAKKVIQKQEAHYEAGD